MPDRSFYVGLVVGAGIYIVITIAQTALFFWRTRK